MIYNITWPKSACQILAWTLLKYFGRNVEYPLENTKKSRERLELAKQIAKRNEGVKVEGVPWHTINSPLSLAKTFFYENSIDDEFLKKVLAYVDLRRFRYLETTPFFCENKDFFLELEESVSHYLEKLNIKREVNESIERIK